MKFFRKYIFPALYGLLVYFTIRLLHDTDIGQHFWERDFYVNGIEMACSILVGYLAIYIFERLFTYYDRHQTVQLSYRAVVRELAILVGANLILVNVVFVPMVMALHVSQGIDELMPWADVADINMIPTLYAIVYYGIARSSTWLKAYVNNKMQLEKLTNDQLETELKFLKAQYHPHFLFNALNTIYFQMDDDVPGAKKSTELLSSLLRYQLYDQHQQVPVKQELEYLENYIRLQQIRASSKMRLSVNFEGSLTDQLIYPLLLLPLVENAFKYIGGEYKIAIEGRIIDDRFVFKVYNDVPPNMKAPDNYSGIGLENLSRRLQLLYPDKHKLIAGREENHYTAVLELNI
ncbi:sensor histidine kinase YesM [Mucilaginibacter sp. SG538B]|uniref:sensor histidine kinase n=1 Tax=Mucilaginibacter sp. SG538B TaxID=2587021 RepID=UPI00159DF332|nr:sensor histidine kinase [Mucilaginibacter sp. SG538B]NVM65464.1 sensor histidine kinase YesM [Mucilaginibacter sp. SG538B]